MLVQVLGEDSSTFPPVLDLKSFGIFTSALGNKGNVVQKQVAKDLVLFFI